jgi:acyl-CoA synthetase (AMP-forming)/AMP-acid ligase II
MRIHDYLDEWAARSPGTQCASDGEQALTWAAMRAWSNRIGRWLADQLEPGSRIGVLSKNSLAFAALYFGASRAGVVVVPLNVRLAPPEWAFIVGDAEVKLLVAEAELAADLDQALGSTAIERAAIGEAPPGWRSFDAEVAHQDDTTVDRDVTPDQPLYQMYTSGTTGAPKGAVLSQAAVTANVTQILIALGRQGKKAMVVMPLYHCAAAVTAIAYIAAGTSLRIVRDFRPAEVVRILIDEDIAYTNLAPAMLQMLLDEPSLAGRATPSLDLIVYGAAPIASDVLRRAIDMFGCDFVQAYGMTELSAVAAILHPDDHRRGLADEPGMLLSAGRPVLGTDLRIVDVDDRELPPGEVGELVVRGPQMMTGYWNRPDANADALRGGWMHTGDAGYVDDAGYVYLCDRVKDMIVSGGENVYPRETEDALFKLEGVADAAVIGVPDERWGETVKAFVVTRPGVMLTAEEVIAHCRELLAGFKCPRSVEFLDELPRNATGKVLKRELRASYWRGRVRAVN